MLSGAEACNSYISRKRRKISLLSLSIQGVDTAENGPPKVWGERECSACFIDTAAMSHNWANNATQHATIADRQATTKSRHPWVQP